MGVEEGLERGTETQRGTETWGVARDRETDTKIQSHDVEG